MVAYDLGARAHEDVTAHASDLHCVVGDEPIIGPTPAAGANAMEAASYAESRRQFLAYTEAKASAEHFSIPVLSLNRFMSLMGLAERK